MFLHVTKLCLTKAGVLVAMPSIPNFKWDLFLEGWLICSVLWTDMLQSQELLVEHLVQSNWEVESSFSSICAIPMIWVNLLYICKERKLYLMLHFSVLCPNDMEQFIFLSCSKLYLIFTFNGLNTSYQLYCLPCHTFRTGRTECIQGQT